MLPITLHDWKVRHNTVIDGNTAHLAVGNNDWQLPILASQNYRMAIDIKEGAEEILTCEIGRNELAARSITCLCGCSAELISAMNQKYAQKIVSSKGKDGLYWPVSPGEAPSLLGSAFSPKEPGAGYHGYRFRILPDEKGFAMVAWLCQLWPDRRHELCHRP
ncbi:DUF2950 family protein [Enterobacter cloacae subsp. cloacae]|nr:DUF2950 family protein [Enterobacter cloacae subsp. cloacae]